jgi:hypothetical protein
VDPLIKWSPARAAGWVPPHLSWQNHFISARKKTFFILQKKKFLVCLAWANPEPSIKYNFMNTQLPTQSALVSILPCKSHDFLYVIKKVNTDLWLPRIPKAVVKDSIQSPGLYEIIYRLYTNAAGYESIYISKAKKIQTS